MEQQFSIRSFSQQIENVSQEQAKELLIGLYTQMIAKENAYKQLLQHKWGFDSLTPSRQPNCPE